MEQLDLFEFSKYKIDKDIRLIELFAGVGSQMMSLRNLKNKGVIKQNLESYKVVEFDKYAIASYNAIHGTDFPTMDITKIHADDLEIKDCDKYTYIMTYSFPCTDLSLAGKQMEMKKGSGTRSGLLWEVERLLNEAQNLRQVLLMENVPQVHADVNIDDFNSWIRFLRSKGYINFYKDLNAKDYGVAQNRERCFMISFLSDEFQDYEFPETQKLTKTVRDYLEEEVDEKYYINNEKAMKLIKDLVERGLPTCNTDKQAIWN